MKAEALDPTCGELALEDVMVMSYHGMMMMMMMVMVVVVVISSL